MPLKGAPQRGPGGLGGLCPSSSFSAFSLRPSETQCPGNEIIYIHNSSFLAACAVGIWGPHCKFLAVCLNPRFNW